MQTPYGFTWKELTVLVSDSLKKKLSMIGRKQGWDEYWLTVFTGFHWGQFYYFCCKWQIQTNFEVSMSTSTSGSEMKSQISFYVIGTFNLSLATEPHSSHQKYIHMLIEMNIGFLPGPHWGHLSAP